MLPKFDSDAELAEHLKIAYSTFLKQGYRLHPGTTAWDERDLLHHAQQVRDVRLREIPVLPGAIGTFVELAATREWAVAGKPRAAARAVESLNETETWDVESGRVLYGLEQFIRRRAMDHVTVGRTAFAYKRRPTLSANPLEYLDPTILFFDPKDPLKKEVLKYPRDYPNAWFYAGGEYYHNDEVTIHHPLPVGVNRFVPPIYFLMPSATLAWLLQEHNIASLDGRKIRDIFFVGNAGLLQAVENALVQQAAIWAGEPVSKVGLPMVHLNVQGNQDISKLIHRMGISEVPKNFDAAQFLDFYVNQIASGIGIALRHFWNTNTATTNRAVEEVAERRQESKGPAAFIRAEERLINGCGYLEQFGKGRNRVRFGFVEEVDVSTRLAKAEYLERISKALNLIAKVFGVEVNLDAYLSWMQSIDALPADMTLISSDTPDTKIEKSDDNLSITEDESIVDGTPEPTAFSQEQKSIFLDYDEVLMSGQGVILDRRVKTFSIFSAIRPQTPLPPKSAKKDIWESAIAMACAENQTYLKDSLQQYAEEGSPLHIYLNNWMTSQMLFPRDSVSSALNKIFEDTALTEDEQNVVDFLAGEVEEWLSEAQYG